MDVVGKIYNSIYKGRDDVQSQPANSANVTVKGAEGKTISLANLHVGDVFRGEVVDVKGQDIALQLSGNRMLHAKMGEGIALNIGDMLMFQLKENTGDQLLIRPLPNQEMNQMYTMAEKVLTTNGLSLSEKNGNIVMSLMQAGEPLDKANIMKLMQQSYKFPDAKLDTLIAMNKLELPVTEGNIRQFESYMDNTHQLTNTISSMVDDAVNQFASLVSEGTISDAVALQSTLMDIIGVNGEAVTKNAQTTATTEDAVVLQNADVSVEQGLAPVEGEGEQPLSTLEQAKVLVADSENSQLPMTKEDMINLIKTLGDEGMDMKETANLLKQATSSEQVLSDLSQKMLNMSEEGMRAIMNNDGYQSMLKDALKNAWTLDPQKMKSPEELDDFYEKLVKDSERLSAELEQKQGGNESFSKQSGQMHEQVKFMQDLNHNFIYAQIPMKLSDEMHNSELFVYADKKKLAEKKDSVSVLLHLDMEHLGPTDVHVSLTGNQVHGIFYLKDQKSVKVVASNMSELANKLSEKGLTLTSDVVKRPEVKKSPVVEEIIDPDAEKSVKRYNFDVRM